MEVMIVVSSFQSRRDAEHDKLVRTEGKFGGNELMERINSIRIQSGWISRGVY